MATKKYIVQSPIYLRVNSGLQEVMTGEEVSMDQKAAESLVARGKLKLAPAPKKVKEVKIEKTDG